MILLTSIGVFAETLDVQLNKVTVKIDDSIVQSDNILYNGTTYVSLRKIAEILGKQIIWAPNNTVIIKDNVTPTTVPTIVIRKTRANISFVKLKNKLYSLEPIYETASLKDDNNNYYVNSGEYEINTILNLIAGKYTIEKSNNPYLAGSIRNTINSNWEYCISSFIYTDAKNGYTKYLYKNGDKLYNLSRINGSYVDDNGQNFGEYIPISHLFNVLDINPDILKYDNDNKTFLIDLDIKKE